MNHDPNTNHQPAGDEQLRQSLLELHYDLLDDDEASSLKQQIESNPTVARLWADTLVVAGKFAAAAKVGDPGHQATPPDATKNADIRPAKSESDQPPSSGSNRFFRRWLGSLAIAATIAVAVSGIQYWSHLPQAPTGKIRVAVRPVTGADSSARNEFLVSVGPRSDTDPGGQQRTVDGSFDSSMRFVPAVISFRVLSQGAVLFFGTAESSASGPCKISVPDDIAIPGDAVLFVDANPIGGGDDLIRLTVPIEPTRCLTFLSTDRPVYRPGETLFFRSVTLNRRTLAAHLDVPIRFELTDASGVTVDGSTLDGVTERGVGNGAFIIPESASGGSYQLIAKSLDGFFPDQTCKIEVRRYRAVRLKTDLQFSKRSFSAGDRVEAELVVRRADDQIPVAAPVRIKAVVDDNVVYEATSALGINGELAIEFRLPKVIRQGEGTLTIAIDDGSVTETAARPIPIHTGRAQVDFYPEGGYLVGGVSNRVYFAARDTDGNPIEISGEILSQAGRMVATVKTVRDGLGRFEFKPESGQRYSLRITSPLDITETPWLPSVVEALPVIDTGVGVFQPDEPISMTIRSTKRRQCIIRVVCRGELVGVKTMELGIGETPVSVPIQDRASGVIRVTVLGTEGDTATPLVERLVYRRVQGQLNITAQVDNESDAGTQAESRVHSPGESVRMTIAVTDENGRKVPGAVLGVSVVDDAATSLRQQEIPSIETHFLLTSEVESPEDLEHANFYLSNAAGAAESLDLLLGTQGWRRFVSGTPNQSDESFRDALARLLELDGRRSGLIGETQTNEASMMALLGEYRVHVTAAWNGFMAEIRFLLIIIGVIWLIGFFLRPRKSAVVAAGLLLLGIVCLAQVGCGGSVREAYVADSASREKSDDNYEQDMAVAEGSEAIPGDVDQHSGKQHDGVQQEPFVQRVVNAFLGQRGAKTHTEVSQSRLSAEQLRKWAQSRDMDAQALADQLMEELRFPIRQYAHLHRPSEDQVRSDFAETLYWNPSMVTDSTGTATIRFDLSDSLTMFRVHVDGHAGGGRLGGRLGSGGGSIVTSAPIQVEPKLPLEVTGGDRIDLPVGLVNATNQSGPMKVSIETDDALTPKRTSALTSIDASGRTTEVFSIDVAALPIASDAMIRVLAEFDGGTLSDQVERSVRIVPDGYPFELSESGSLSKNASVKPKLPETVVAGSLTGSLEIFPSTRSQLSAGLESILREPHGCFEQASASNYPNVMAFQLLRLDGAVDSSAEKRTVSLLRRGYRKLTRYECSTLGYEWFGNDPGHEALSAFGLMQFSEMAEFIDIDQEMLDRTRNWLLSRRDGKGGFQRNSRHLHVWSVQQEVVNAYLLWALSQADRVTKKASRTTTDLSAELDAMQTVANASSDPYLIALSAITLQNVNRSDGSRKLLDRLVDLQNADGSLVGVTTITQSGGISRTVETTSLAILAWASSESHQSPAKQAATWLINNRQSGGFGSTQATVLALKALIAVHDQMVSGNGGKVEIVVGDEVVDTIRWEGRPDDGVKWSMTPALLEMFAANPKTQVTLRSNDASSMPFTVRLAGRTTSPASDPNCPVAINLSFAGQGDDTSLHETSLRSGDSVDVIAEIKNSTDVGRPMTVAVIGLPGGLEPVIESLDKLRESGQLDFYELRGREVVLYWRTFAPGESKRIPITCVAAVGGRYTGPPSRAYLYYTAESKTWHRPLVVEVR